MCCNLMHGEGSGGQQMTGVGEAALFDVLGRGTAKVLAGDAVDFMTRQTKF